MELSKDQFAADITAWMRKRRADLGMTVEDVARSMPFKTSFTVVERWFQGRHTPSGEYLVGLCLVLGDLPPALKSLCLDEIVRI
jgi:transcriptional regulator with XRE-family HTH domain